MNPELQMEHTETRLWQEVVQKYAELSHYNWALDIGTSSGMSAWSILTSGKGKVISIDVRNVKDNLTFLTDSIYKNRFQFINMASSEYFQHCGVKFELVVIDGSHKRDDVYRDAVASWDYLQPNGYMVFDDYEHPRYSTDVQPAIQKFLSKLANDSYVFTTMNGKAIIQKI